MVGAISSPPNSSTKVNSQASGLGATKVTDQHDSKEAPPSTDASDGLSERLGPSQARPNPIPTAHDASALANAILGRFQSAPERALAQHTAALEEIRALLVQVGQ